MQTIKDNQLEKTRTVYVRERNNMFEVVCTIPGNGEENYIYCHYTKLEIAVNNAKALAECHNLSWLGVMS